VDSGSTDDTVELARAAGATVWHEPWRGFAGPRQWALSHPGIAHDWVYFLDADEWVSTDLAAEIADRLGPADHAAFAHRRRLVFQGRWIAHCGWYTNSWQVRLLDRRAASFDQDVTYGERPRVVGRVGRLSADLIDEDQKGLASWLHKHVRYAELEAESEPARSSARHRMALAWAAILHRGTSTRPLSRIVARELVFPLLPGRPLMLFVYMYLVRGGWRDGRSGLLFCLYHAWYHLTVGALARSRQGDGTPVTKQPPLAVPGQRGAGSQSKHPTGEHHGQSASRPQPR
jgi:glycosyltransferase involved in cell wall biosynthesis